MITLTRPISPWSFLNPATTVSKLIIARRFVAVDTSDIDAIGCGGFSDGEGGDNTPPKPVAPEQAPPEPYRVEGGGLAIDAPLPAIGEMIANQLHKFLLAKYEEGFLDGLAIGQESIDTDRPTDGSTDTPTDNK
jgi:hypothetical protein